MGWDKQVGSRFSPHLGVGCGVSASMRARVDASDHTRKVVHQHWSWMVRSSASEQRGLL